MTEKALNIHLKAFDKRHSQHDDIIRKVVNNFNTNKSSMIGCTEDQAKGIPDLKPELVKAWIVEETGGSDQHSVAAWKSDPAQVNVPGDWSINKMHIGLQKPVARNSGFPETNLAAAVVWLTRKGFHSSCAPPKYHPKWKFDGWEKALERYTSNDLTANGRPHGKNYSDQISKRAANPETYVPIGLPLQLHFLMKKEFKNSPKGDYQLPDPSLRIT